MSPMSLEDRKESFDALNFYAIDNSMRRESTLVIDFIEIKIGIVVPITRFADACCKDGHPPDRIRDDYLIEESKEGRKYLIEWLPRHEKYNHINLQGVSVLPNYTRGCGCPWEINCLERYYFYDTIKEVRDAINNHLDVTKRCTRELSNLLECVIVEQTSVLESLHKP